MRTIEIKLYNFNELSEESKKVAIEEMRDRYYERNTFASWAIDDCSLFEPPQKEMEELFGKYYDFPLIKNTRKNIYFSTDRGWYLSCDQAMVVRNDEQFLKWLGIDRSIEGLENVSYIIYTPTTRFASTTIKFDDYPLEFDDLIYGACVKFKDHIDNVLRRIEKDIEYRFTDEAIMVDIVSNEYEYTEDGRLYF